jgi:hypothetical protein
VAAGLVQGEHLSVDGSSIEANASRSSRIPREQLAEAAQVKRTVREDPDATYISKSGPAVMGYFDNYLVDNQSCMIVGVQATAARLSQESAAARDMLTRFAQRHGSMPKSLAADAGYGNGEPLNWLEERNITPYMYTREGQARQNSKLYGIDQFTCVPETGNYICPEGKKLNYLGIHTKNRNHVWFSTPARCRDCSQKSQCTTGNHRRLSRAQVTVQDSCTFCQLQERSTRARFGKNLDREYAALTKSLTMDCPPTGPHWFAAAPGAES